MVGWASSGELIHFLLIDFNMFVTFTVQMVCGEIHRGAAGSSPEACCRNSDSSSCAYFRFLFALY